MSPEREFTVEEANALLPTLRESLDRLRAARQTVLKGGVRIRASAPTNGGGSFSGEYLYALTAVRREVELITGEGVILRDAETGLLDFPARREGEQVFLCWRPDEASVGFFHGPETGFAGRRPL